MAAQYDDIVSYYDTYRPRLTHALIKQQEFVIEKIQNPQDSV